MQAKKLHLGPFESQTSSFYTGLCFYFLTPYILLEMFNKGALNLLWPVEQGDKWLGFKIFWEYLEERGKAMFYCVK